DLPDDPQRAGRGPHSRARLGAASNRKCALLRPRFRSRLAAHSRAGLANPAPAAAERPGAVRNRAPWPLRPDRVTPRPVGGIESQPLLGRKNARPWLGRPPGGLLRLGAVAAHSPADQTKGPAPRRDPDRGRPRPADARLELRDAVLGRPLCQGLRRVWRHPSALLLP